MAKKNVISKEKAIEDLSFWKKTLEAIHPNLYHVYTESEFSNSIDCLIESFDNEVSIDELQTELAKISALLCDGHTGVSTNQIERPDNFFPLEIDLHNYKTIRDASENIKKGVRVISINHTKIEEIVEYILPYLWGDKNSFKIALLEYELPIQLWRYYRWKDEFEVEYAYNGKILKKVIKGSPNATFYTPYNGIEGSFEIVNENNEDFGYFKLSEFGDSKAYFELINSVFEKLQKDSIHNLVIDIQDIGGGNTMLADEILMHIADRPYKGYDTIVTKFSKPTRKFYRKYGFKKPYLFPFLCCMPQYWKSHGSRIDSFGEMPLKLSQEDRYYGKVYVITSNFTFSTADDFTRIFKYYNMGTIIGKETGGMRDSFGDCVLFSLPNSKIECSCSHKCFKGLNLNDKNTDGVKPDYVLDCKSYNKEEIIKTIVSLRDNPG
nr:S41 family peptidase [uncultured Carboxylicivirga sp.]